MTELSKWSRLGQSLAIQRQFATHARRMAPGSFGGRTESASPATATRGAPVAGRPAATGGGIPIIGHYYADVNVPHDTVTSITGWQEDFLVGSGLAVSGGGSEVAASVNAMWEFYGHARWDASDVGDRYAMLTCIGAYPDGEVRGPAAATGATYQPIAPVVESNVTDVGAGFGGSLWHDAGFDLGCEVHLFIKALQLGELPT